MNLDRFKYKAKDLEGRWVYAELAIFQESECYMRWVQDNKILGAIAEIDLDTLCQCIGIKDSNGKLIYENDYVKIGEYKGKDNICRIDKYKDITFDLTFEDGHIVPIETLLLLLRHDKKGIVQVIGNRYDIGGGQCPE